MILVLEKGITRDQKNQIRSILFREGCIVREMTEAGQNIIGAVGPLKNANFCSSSRKAKILTTGIH